MKKCIVLQMAKMTLRELLETIVAFVVIAAFLGIPILCILGAFRLIAIAWGERVASFVFLFNFVALIVVIITKGTFDLYKKAKRECERPQ